MRGIPNLIETNKSPFAVILILAWPTIVEQLLQTAVNYVDAAMVGSISVAATAAIGVTQTTVWMINGLMTAVATGFAVIVGRSIGEGDFDRARTVIRQAVLSALAMGVFFTLLAAGVLGPWLAVWMGADPEVIPLSRAYYTTIGASYLFQAFLVMCSNLLRVSGDTKTPLKFNIMTNIINVVGNLLLIYPTRTVTVWDTALTIPGAGLGVFGAAIATAVGMSFSGICLLLVLFRRSGALTIRLNEDYRPRPDVLRQAARLAFPAAVERLTISSGQLVMTALITQLGMAALSAHQLANTGEALCYMPLFGFATAGTTLVSQALGAGKEELAYRYGRSAVRLGVLTISVLSVFMFLFAPQIIDIFTDDAQVIRMGAAVLRIEAFAEPFQAVGTVMAGVLRGAGDTRWPFYAAMAGMWGARVGGALLLMSIFGRSLNVVWVAMALDWFVRAGISLVRFWRKKWLYAWKEPAKQKAC